MGWTGCRGGCENFIRIDWQPNRLNVSGDGRCGCCGGGFTVVAQDRLRLRHTSQQRHL
jgi:hypothetical protein